MCRYRYFVLGRIYYPSRWFKNKVPIFIYRTGVHSSYMSYQPAAYRRLYVIQSQANRPRMSLLLPALTMSLNGETTAMQDFFLPKTSWKVVVAFLPNLCQSTLQLLLGHCVCYSLLPCFFHNRPIIRNSVRYRVPYRYLPTYLLTIRLICNYRNNV